VKEFDRHASSEHGVLCFVNGTHSAVAQRAHEPVLSVDDATDIDHDKLAPA
jgi:hypothetical protein